MSILSKTEIQKRLGLEITNEKSLVITPRPREKTFDYDSVDLRLGCHFLMPQMPPEPRWGSAQVRGHSHTRVHVPLGSYFVVPAHETVLGATLEFIKLPKTFPVRYSRSPLSRAVSWSSRRLRGYTRCIEDA